MGITPTILALAETLGSGLSAATSVGGLSGALGSGLAGLGVGGETAGVLGTLGAGALEGSGLGAISSAITGGKPLKGAEMGALTGLATAGIGEGLSGLGVGGSAGAAGAAGGGGGASAVTPAAASLPAGSALDPTATFSSAAVQPTALPAVSAQDVLGQLSPGAGVGGGGIGMTTATGPFSGSGLYGGPPAATSGGGGFMATTPTTAAGPFTEAVTQGAPTGGAYPAATINPNVPVTPDITGQQVTNVTPDPYAISNLNTTLPTVPASPSAFSQSTVGQLIDHPSWSGAGDVLAANPGAVLNALGLGYNLMNRGNVSGLNALKSQTQAIQQQGKAMENYMATGTLPQGLQAGIDQATAAAKQEIKNKYAQLGMSGSTAEASDLAYTHVNAETRKAEMEMNLWDQGNKAALDSAGLLKDIIGINQTQDAATGQAIAALASSLSGMPLQTRTQASG